ncbi:prephenate dehydratase domain-containing protein, partial [Brevundimonas sp.]
MTTGEDIRPARISYQGAPGAFSHEACMDLRPWDVPVAFETFEGAIQAVLTGDCDLALIPLENTTVGTVEPAATLVREAGLEPLSEAWRPIRHALLGLPDARLSD